MKAGKLILLLSLAITFGCKQEVKEENAEIKREIRNLKTLEEKKKYLENIFEEDQKVRGAEDAEIMLKYGNNSKEHRAYIQRQIDQDARNLIKIEEYFAQYGHPKKAELGGMAAQTPWAVIHHASTFEERERNFEYLYKAYLNGDIDDGAISFYLGRMYQIKNGERLKMKNPYRAEDEINQLIKELNLEEKQAKAHQE